MCLFIIQVHSQRLSSMMSSIYLSPPSPDNLASGRASRLSKSPSFPPYDREIKAQPDHEADLNTETNKPATDITFSTYKEDNSEIRNQPPPAHEQEMDKLEESIFNMPPEDRNDSNQDEQDSGSHHVRPETSVSAELAQSEDLTDGSESALDTEDL